VSIFEILFVLTRHGKRFFTSSHYPGNFQIGIVQVARKEIEFIKH